MPSSAGRFAEEPAAVVEAALSDTDDLLVVNPCGAVIGALVDSLEEIDTQVRLFAAPGPLKEKLADFRVAAVVADLVAEGSLEVRTLDQIPRNALLVTESSLTALVQGPDRIAGLETDDAAFAGEAYAMYDNRWTDAQPFTLRTPPLSTVRETLGKEIGEAARTDFDAMLSALNSTRGDGEGLDEVTVSLLVAARNRELLYDISKWGEDVGLASKATFSRAKADLEEAGLLATEKVPIEVGRPRLRLLLPDGLRGESAAGLAETAAARL